MAKFGRREGAENVGAAIASAAINGRASGAKESRDAASMVAGIICRSSRDGRSEKRATKISRVRTPSAVRARNVGRGAPYARRPKGDTEAGTTRARAPRTENLNFSEAAFRTSRGFRAATHALAGETAV